MARFPSRTAAVLILGGLLCSAPGAARSRSGGDLPPIVFVSRAPLPDSLRGQVPGLGPHGTFAGAGGRLLERSPTGHVRALVPAERLYDVAGPAVSDDGAKVAFAARERADSPWRVWTVDRLVNGEPAPDAGHGLACATCDDAAGDDADPTWWGDTLLFVSTRTPARSLYDGTPVTQLWARFPDGRRAQVTHEANGVLDPVADAERRRLVFSRWWFNPWHPAADGGVTRAAMGAPDSVNLWQVVNARLVRGVDGALRLDDMRLAAGGTLPRRSGMGVQPAPLSDGGLLAVATHNTGLSPRPGTLALVRYGKPPGAGHRLAGAAIGDDAADPYTEAANLRAPAACAPAVLADDRIVCALDPGGHGDFGLFLLDAKGERPTALVDSVGAWELDPAPVPEKPRAREAAPRAKQGVATEVISQPGQRPTFRYFNTDVFGSRAAAPRREDAFLLVFRLAGPDSLVLLSRSAVPRMGKVDLQLPADVPLFEMLTDPAGHALMTAHGPTQVRGFNAGGAGSTAKCSGCHLGHSANP